MARASIPFKQIADSALSSIDTLLSRWLPGGKTQSGEYKVTNPNRADNRVGSFSINMRTGKWGDFATNDAGNDLISLYAYLEGLDQKEAAIEVADQIGFTLPNGVRPDDSKPRQKPVIDTATIKQAKPKEESPWHPVTPVPDSAEDAPLAHPNRGLPAAKWAYKDTAGQLLGYVYRFNTSDGGKETLPLTYCVNADTGKHEWRWMQWTAPNRPLYGLDRLAAKPDAYVLLVEGEKCADAPLNLLTKCAIVSWPGGGKAIDKIDWTPLAGRKIYAWPDCDSQRIKPTKAEAEQGVEAESLPLMPEHEQAGVRAMLAIKAQLLAIDPATEFNMVSIPAPGEVPSGWDIADAIDAGWGAERLRDFIANTRAYGVAEAEKTLHTPKSASAEKQEGDSWRHTLLTNSKGQLLDSRENVFLFLNHHPDLEGLIAFDEFALRIIKRHPAPWDKPFEGEKPWDDNDSLELALWMAQTNDLSIRSMDSINHAVKLVSSRNAYDPLVQYLDALVWDGVKRNKHWLTDFAGVKACEYANLAGSLFLRGMVARAYKPGCIMRTMPVFEGLQYRGKSSVARCLAGKWFSDSPLELKGKDGFINIQGVWLQEIAELGSFNNQEAPIIKAYLSSASDRFRSPFDKYARDYPRRTVFFGTTNEDVYLRDKTGNSRFWPFRTEEQGNIDLDGLAQVRDQLFAEAVQEFKAGERWHPLEDEQLRLFAPEQSLREYDDPWEERIIDWLRQETFSSTSVSVVLTDCLKIEAGKQTPFNAQQVGKILTRLGWKKSRPDADGATRKRVYLRPADDVIEQGSLSGNDDDSIPF
jgi:predicted P-loop ATPase